MAYQTVPMPLWSIRSVRLQLLALLASVLCVVSAGRSSLSISLLCIVSDPVSNGSANCHEPLELNWSLRQQSWIHTSYYIGGMISVLTSSVLINRFGPKNIISVTLMTTAAGAFCTPVIVILFRNALLLSLLRGVMGFGFGFLIPAASVLISKWFPIQEKSTAMAVYTTGNQVGIAVGMLLTAKLSQAPLLGGWPLAWIFYGTLSGAMLIVWAFLAADKPRLSKFITAVELEHIGGRVRTATIPVETPYLRILVNPCVNAICLCSFAQSFVLVGLITYLPLFNQSAMKMHMSLNGLLSALPFCIQIVAKLLAGTAADHMKIRKMSVTVVTKLFNGIASFGTAVVLLLIGFLDQESALLASLLIIFSMIFFSAYVAGYNTSIVAALPMFTAFLSSYSQIYAQIGSSVAPVVLAVVQGDDGDWSIVFYIFSAILLVSGLIFQLFGHGRSEKWAEPQEAGDANQRLAMELCPTRSHRPSTRVSFRDEQEL